MKQNNKHKNVTSIILEYAWQHKLLTLSMIVIIVGVVFASLLPPQILKTIIDKYLMSTDSNSLMKIAIIYFLALVLVGLLDFAKQCMLTITGQGIITDVRKKLMQKKNRMKAQYFTKNSTGEIVSVFTNDVDTIGELFTDGILGMFIDVFKIVGIIISIWIFSYRLAIIVLLSVPIIFVITRMFQKKMLKAQLIDRKYIAKVNNHIPESIQNIEMIKSFRKEEYFEDKYSQYITESYTSKEKINFYDSIFSPIVLVIRATIIGIMVVLCSDSISLLGISVGMVAAAIDLISNIFSPIESLGMELQSIQKAIAGVKRVNNFFGEDEISNINHDFDIKDIKDSSIEVENLCFSYDGDDNVIDNISFKINRNESVTIIGRTGEGKSTLFKLMNGLLEPDSGMIKIGGIDLNTIPNTYKRQIFGYVEQSFHFIDGTVLEQITLRDKSITKEQVENALKFVGLDEYIKGFDNGYETIAKENMFSQGQRQLLSIARAIASNPPIMMLDEMTANLDSDTEKNILEVLRKLGEEKTLISISHRMSEILSTSKVIKLENGKISIK